uniref:Uncharacterized protein n=1 Tax=Onchocerca volvulus TaxID=6282 RepID=A0A8R1TT70_ONCVO
MRKSQHSENDAVAEVRVTQPEKLKDQKDSYNRHPHSRLLLDVRQEGDFRNRREPHCTNLRARPLRVYYFPGGRRDMCPSFSGTHLKNFWSIYENIRVLVLREDSA